MTSSHSAIAESIETPWLIGKMADAAESLSRRRQDPTVDELIKQGRELGQEVLSVAHLSRCHRGPVPAYNDISRIPIVDTVRHARRVSVERIENDGVRLYDEHDRTTSWFGHHSRSGTWSRSNVSSVLVTEFGHKGVLKSAKYGRYPHESVHNDQVWLPFQHGVSLDKLFTIDLMSVSAQHDLSLPGNHRIRKGLRNRLHQALQGLNLLRRQHLG